MAEYGYVRVSTADQNEDRQLIAMSEAGVPMDHIYTDKQSGKDFERAAYKKLVKKLKPGDVVTFKSIDRMGRNYKDIIDQWRIITKDRGADVVVLDMPLLDTRKEKNLTGTLISDIVFSSCPMWLRRSESISVSVRQRESQRQRSAGFALAGRRKKYRPTSMMSSAGGRRRS